MKIRTPLQELADYYAADQPLICELDVNPYRCEFWPQQELTECNRQYDVSRYAPGYFGFATSGGGEMFALSPSGAVVCLPFVGMEPAAAYPVAPSWTAFVAMLRADPE